MDENGYMMDIAESSKIVFSKYQKQAFMNQTRNWEWASFIKAICTNIRWLLLFVILNGKRWKDYRYPSDMEKDAQISLSKNGWTNNKLYMEWMRD